MMAAEHQAALRGRLRHDESMARHVSWRTGGPARTFYEPADAGDLAVFLKQLPADEPLLWLGLGSNLLVRDGGIPGTVIATSGALMELVQIDALAIRAGTGVACNKVARFCAGLNLVGGEFLAGIPGTMGGALAMNAGAFGGETWPLVRRVETIDRHGTRRWHEPGDFRVAYREVHGPAEEWFITVELQLQSGDGAAGLARVKELLERRNRSQPIGLPSCGSVFRNPPGDHAARLIEACGLKGTCRGGACISTKHANFIINSGDASAADIEALITQVAEAVEQAHGVRLQREVHIVGVAAGGVQS
ncbi:MAG: UDP-N-acetylmuramate dehydrogenase [Gammaproteobacteria bacterium]|jgi:UDP-N-acetylmuramate dehydrogenase